MMSARSTVRAPVIQQAVCKWANFPYKQVRCFHSYVTTFSRVILKVILRYNVNRTIRLGLHDNVKKFLDVKTLSLHEKSMAAFQAW